MLTRLHSVLHHLNHTKAMSHNTNVACCTIPPVKSDQKSSGSFGPFAGFNRVYTTGESTEKAVVCVFDIFGFWNQTQIGADRLAETLKVKVFMPDFFEPNEPFHISKFPPKTDEDNAALQAFFSPGGTAEVPKATEALKAFGKTLRDKGFKQVAVYGFCWGGKVVMKAGSSDIFDGLAIIHPAMVDAKDAESLQAPLGLYPSNDEPVSECEKVMKVLSSKPFASKNSYKLYANMFHGWAAARANLEDPENLQEFNDLYSTLAGFLNNVWKA